VQKGSFQLELYPIKSAQSQGERISKLISLGEPAIITTIVIFCFQTFGNFLLMKTPDFSEFVS